MKNYIGNNNQINKKKYKKSLSPFCNLNAGNVEYNINTFNKMSSTGSVPSSAEGMSGMSEDYDRNEIIAEIRSYGYPFNRYNLKEKSDAALFRILKDARESQENKFRYKPKRKDTIDINTDHHIMNDDPKYNFEDPDRVGEYKVENLTIREQLNRLDKRAFNNDEVFYDLRSIYEGIEHRLSSQEKAELKNLLNTTNDADAVKAYLDSKDPQKKNEDLDDDFIDVHDRDEINWQMHDYDYEPFYDELKKYMKPGETWDAEDEEGYPASSNVDLKTLFSRMPHFKQKRFMKKFKIHESTDNLTYDELIELAHKYYKQGGAEIIEFWDENSLKEYEKEFGPMTKDTAIRLMKVMGNVTADEEAAGEYFSKQTYENYSVQSNSATNSVDVVNNDTDEIVSRHRGETALESANKEKDIMNMNEEFNWDDLSLDIYIDEFKEAEDIEDLEDIVHEIYSYNKPLFVKLRHFPKDASFEELRDNKIQILQAEKNKVKESKEVKKSLFIIKDKHGNQLSAPTEDQDELWDRVSAMEQRGRRGLKVVAYVPESLSEEIKSDYRVNTYIENEDKITLSQLRKNISSYPEGTYLRFAIKGPINALNNYTYGYVKTNEDSWVAYSTLVGLFSNPAKSDQQLLQFIEKKNVKNIGLKLPKNLSKSQVSEDYTKEDEDWGDPYTFDEIYDQLEKLTHKFKEKKGNVRCWYNQEKMFGIQILKDYYEDVEVSDAKSEDTDERYWIITYSHPKKEDEE